MPFGNRASTVHLIIRIELGDPRFLPRSSDDSCDHTFTRLTPVLAEIRLDHLLAFAPRVPLLIMFELCFQPVHQVFTLFLTMNVDLDLSDIPSGL